MIKNEARYEAAIRRNIRINANKTRTDKWLATEDGRRANAFLWGLDEFEDSYREDGSFKALHPVVKVSLGDFYDKMRQAVNEWGALTEGQTKAVLAMIERGEARVAEREEAMRAKADRSGWIGNVGERMVFTLTIQMVISMEGQYGYSYLHVTEADDGNTVIYKGTNCLGERGDKVTVKATVKEHDIRDGVKQTKISRPKGV
jgi:hypothetical protein